MPSSTWDSEQGWQLYLDWCEATGTTPGQMIEEDLARFFRDVPSAQATRRVRERTIRRRLGLPASSAGESETGPGPAWRNPAGFADLHRSLAHIPSAGWTSGLRGRRDAFLLVAIHQGLTRGEVSGLTPDAVSIGDGENPQIRLVGTPVPGAENPFSCPRCTVTRWLNALGLNRAWGKAVLRSALIRQHRTDSGHVCRRGPTHTEWVNTPTLLPSIDRHGWIDEHRGLSRRSVSAVLARRQTDPLTSPWRPESVTGAHQADDLAESPRQTTGQRRSAEQFARLTRLLDQMEETADSHFDHIRRVEAEARELGIRASGK